MILTTEALLFHSSVQFPFTACLQSTRPLHSPVNQPTSQVAHTRPRCHPPHCLEPRAFQRGRVGKGWHPCL